MQVSAERLLVLRAVAEHGGVLAAGRALHLAPSGISQHLAALERETGLELLDRSRRGGQRRAVLTVAGRRLAAHGARLAELLAEVEVDVTTMTGAVAGPVTIATFTTAIRPIVTPAIARLAHSHPALRPHVRELDLDRGLAALGTGEIDVLIDEHDAQERPRLPAGVARRALRADPYLLAVPADWPVPTSLADVAERPWVDGPAGSTVHRILARLRAGTGLTLPAQHWCIEFPAALALVQSGLAVALVPALAAPEPPPAEVRLTQPAGLGARRIVALYRRPTRALPPLTAVLLDALAASD